MIGRNNTLGPLGRLGKTDGEYSVAQFFVNGSYEYVRRWVGIEEAVNASYHYIHSIAAKHGFVRKVIITDGGDFTNFMWEFDKGVVYPRRDANGEFVADE